MVFGLSTSVTLLIALAIIFFGSAFLVTKFFKWLIILGVLALLVAGYFWWF